MSKTTFETIPWAYSLAWPFYFAGYVGEKQLEIQFNHSKEMKSLHKLITHSNFY